jgi:enoyl-CoA hydratase/carnithine racemase
MLKVLNHILDGVHVIQGLSQLLSRICGPSNAILAVMASMPIPASKALAWTLVSELTETPDDLLPAALHIARGITYNNGNVVRGLKVSFKEGYAMTFGDAKECELKCNEDYFASIGGGKSRVLEEGATRFNERVRELNAPDMKMRGGMAD